MKSVDQLTLKAILSVFRYFGIFFDVLTLLNAVVIGISDSDDDWDDAAEWAFLSLFMLEIFLKLYAYGSRRFFKKVWNV